MVGFRRLTHAGERLAGFINRQQEEIHADRVRRANNRIQELQLREKELRLKEREVKLKERLAKAKARVIA